MEMVLNKMSDLEITFTYFENKKKTQIVSGQFNPVMCVVLTVEEENNKCQNPIFHCDLFLWW